MERGFVMIRDTWRSKTMTESGTWSKERRHNRVLQYALYSDSFCIFNVAHLSLTLS